MDNRPEKRIVDTQQNMDILEKCLFTEVFICEKHEEKHWI